MPATLCVPLHGMALEGISLRYPVFWGSTVDETGHVGAENQAGLAVCISHKAEPNKHPSLARLIWMNWQVFLGLERCLFEYRSL